MVWTSIMDSTSLTKVIVTLLSVLAISEAAKWSYSGDSGPHYWHEMFPHACSGKYQSPIDLKPEETLYNPNLKDFAIWYDPPKKDSKMFVKNNGHTVQVDLEGDFFVTNGGLPNVYKALQFHFHWGHKAHHGSEHLMDGKASPIELHLVTFNHDMYSDVGEAVVARGGLAVLGVMFEISDEDNPVLAPIVTALKHIRDPEARTKISIPLISLRDLLPSDITRYYRYNGSLTTPGCFESVTWSVFDQKQTISHQQLKEFRRLLQFRHKHKKHGSGDSRHRRSLTREQKHMEHKAMDVLDELGIRGNDFEEMIFKKELMTSRQDQMLADMPPGGSDDATVKLKPILDEARAAQIEKSIDEHVGADSPEKHSSHEPADVDTEVEEYEYRQDIMVNNFRPVQPLNGRLVYRSFKLREPMAEVEVDPVDHAPVYANVDSKKDCDSASFHGMSLVTVFILSLFSFLFA